MKDTCTSSDSHLMYLPLLVCFHPHLALTFYYFFRHPTPHAAVCQFVHVLAGALGLGPTLAAVDLSELDWDDDEEEKGGDMVARAASGSSELVVAPRAGISRSHLEPAAESAALGKAAELCELFATVDAAGSGRVDWETFSSFMVPRPPPARWLPLPRPVLQRSSPYPFLLTPPPPTPFSHAPRPPRGECGVGASACARVCLDNNLLTGVYRVPHWCWCWCSCWCCSCWWRGR